MHRALAWVGLLLGLAALILQLTLAIPASMARGHGLLAALVTFFSFFTILSNVAVVLVYAASLGFGPGFFGRTRVRAGIAVAISVVSIVYIAILSRLWSPQGLLYAADFALHYVAPGLYMIWWFAYGRDGTARLADIPRWLAYPLLYLVYVLIRSPFADEVPYPFLDYWSNGWPATLLSITWMLVLFVVMGVVVAMADRLPASKDRSPEPPGP